MAREAVTRRVLAATAAISSVLLVSGCSLSTHQDSGTSEVDHAPAKVVLNFPDGFRNVAFKCNGTTGVYVTSASTADTLPSGVAVLANDPACTH